MDNMERSSKSRVSECKIRWRAHFPVRLSLPCLELTQESQIYDLGKARRTRHRILRDLIPDVEVLPGETDPGWGGKGSSGEKAGR